jgi:hypothetical protein
MEKGAAQGARNPQNKEILMNTGVFSEYLGDIATEALLQNLTNTNVNHSSIDAIRAAIPGGFSVVAEIELSIMDTAEFGPLKVWGRTLNEKEVEALLRQPRKLIRIVITPNLD